MLSIIEIDHEKLQFCYELDANTICLWSKEQWRSELKKNGTRIMGLLFSTKIIGVCVFQVVIDEAQINYFSIDRKFRRKGYGSFLMNNMVEECRKLNLKKLLLEVSEANSIAVNFYTKFRFLTVGKRKNYYKDGSDAFLKEKKLIKK